MKDLETVLKFWKHGSVYPILDYVHIKSEKNRTVYEVNNIDSYIQMTETRENPKFHRINTCVKIKQVKEIIKDSTITEMSEANNRNVIIKDSDDCEYILESRDKDEFPMCTEDIIPPETLAFTVNLEELASGLTNALVYTADKNELREALQCVNVEVKNDVVMLQATDGRRAYNKKIKCGRVENYDEKCSRFLLKENDARLLINVAKLSKDKEEVIFIKTKEETGKEKEVYGIFMPIMTKNRNHIGLFINTSNLKFPSVEPILKYFTNIEVTVDRKEFKDVIDKFFKTLYNSKELPLVKSEISKTGMLFKSATAEYSLTKKINATRIEGEGVEEVDEYLLSFDCEYFKDMLNIVTDDKITILLNNSNHSELGCITTPIKIKNGDETHIIMPVKLIKPEKEEN